MKTLSTSLAAGALALAGFAPFAAAKPLSDLASPEKRRTAVDLAQHLSRPPEPAPTPADLPQPFNPAGFDQPDPEEAKAVALALAKAGANGAAPAGGGGPNQVARAPGDREILESLAAKLPSKGTIIMGGEPVLVLTGGRVKVGDTFTVQDNASGKEYQLELVAIERTTFTLRYHGEEFVRPIKNGK